MVTGGVTKTFTSHGTSAPLAENVTKLAPMAIVMMKFATVATKFKSQEAAMMFICNAQESAVEVEDAKPLLSEIQMFWVTLNSPVCLWTKSSARGQVSHLSIRGVSGNTVTRLRQVTLRYDFFW